MSRYFCIYQNIIKREISQDDAKDVKTVSLDYCQRVGLCQGHTEQSNGAIIQQSHCEGHRLKNKNLNSYNFPDDILKGNLAECDQYNKIFSIINNEINNRLKSPLYSKYSANINNLKSKVNQLDTEDLITKDDINKLNNYIKNAVLYQDTAKQPTFTNLNKNTIAKHDALNESINAIKTLIQDCICYSDCNEYSICSCYGNCNHY